MNNPRILFIAPSSYPIFGAEANVNAKLIKVLTERGAVLDVVSRAPRHNMPIYPESTNENFFHKVASINVIETDTKRNLKTILRHIKTFLKFGFVYKAADWAIDALPICEGLIKHHKYDFIYTFNQPSEILGLYLSKKYSIPLVATWNDPYVWERYPKPYGFGPHKKISQNREKLISVLGKSCYKHIFPSLRLMKYMQKYMHGITEQNSVICPHIMLERVERNRISDNTLSIIHSGALGRERNPMKFLSALSNFISKNPDAKIEVSFLGVVERMDTKSIFDFVTEYKLERYVRFLPAVSYEESINELRNYDLSLIIEANCDEGIFLPSKVADYLQAGIPIYTISPSKGVLNDLYREGIINYFSDCNNEDSITEALELIYKDFIDKRLVTAQSVAYNRFGGEAIYNLHNKYIWE